MITRLRALLNARRGEAAVVEDEEVAAEAEGANQAALGALSALLSEIEAAACAVYGRHGLPVQPGHYARSNRTGEWRYLSENLTAGERWELVLAQKPGSGWRFGSLPDIGDRADASEEVREASLILRSCHQLRTSSAAGAASASDLEAAIRLGAAWGRAEAAPAEGAPAGPAPKKAVRKKPVKKPPQDAALELPLEDTPAAPKKAARTRARPPRA